MAAFKCITEFSFLVHSVDTTRMDIVIPGEQHLYLRAATSQERQLWLVALGSAKACVQNKNRKESGKHCLYYILHNLSLTEISFS